MAQSSPPSSPQGPAFIQQAVNYQAPSENIVMNKYHLALVLERYHKRDSPTLEHVFIPLIAFIGTLLAALPADFKDFMSISKHTWEAFVMLLLVGFGIATLYLGGKWIKNSAKNPAKSPEEIIDEIMREMEEVSQRLETSTESRSH